MSMHVHDCVMFIVFQLISISNFRINLCNTLQWQAIFVRSGWSVDRKYKRMAGQPASQDEHGVTSIFYSVDHFLLTPPFCYVVLETIATTQMWSWDACNAGKSFCPRQDRVRRYLQDNKDDIEAFIDKLIRMLNTWMLACAYRSKDILVNTSMILLFSTPLLTQSAPQQQNPWDKYYFLFGEGARYFMIITQITFLLQMELSASVMTSNKHDKYKSCTLSPQQWGNCLRSHVPLSTLSANTSITLIL